jgi:AcrR family transcriptional regulator
MVVNKHQQKSEATRRRLLDAALRIFARDGFEAARLEDIAKESGHTRGAFYANFDTKEDLFLALLEQQSNERLLDLRRTLEKYASVEDRVAAVRAFYVGRATDRQYTLLTLEFKLFALRHPHLHARLADAHRRIRASLNHESLTRLLPAAPNAPQAEVNKVLLEVVLSGLVLEHAYDPKRVSSKQLAEMLGRTFDMLITSNHV